MSEHTLTFGKYKDKDLQTVSVEDPGYVTWLAGVVTKYSLQPRNVQIWGEMERNHPDAIACARAFVEGKCLVCLQHAYDPVRPCKKSQPTRNYQYHPYGKRD
jgi:hypothetical protein